MTAPSPSTLDIDEDQVLVDFYEDEHGMFWHQRILLLPTATPGVWVACSRDWDLERLDLHSHRVIALPRAGAFPANRIGQVYHLDSPVDAGELRRARAGARELQRVLGPPMHPASAAGSASVWRIADPAHASFGGELPPGLTSDASAFIAAPSSSGTSGLAAALVLLDDGWTFAQCVSPAELTDWRIALTSARGHDARIIADRRDPSSQKRSIPFAEAVQLVSVPSEPPFSLPGERVTAEFLTALRSSGMEWMSHHLDFVHKSGLSVASGTCRAHRRLSESLQLFLQDQLNLPALAGAELLVRYLVQIETAVARNPRAPVR